MKEAAVTGRFDGPQQPYRTRGGEWAVVLGLEEDHYNGVLLPSELESSWDLQGNDLDGQRQFDLLASLPQSHPDAIRWRSKVESLRDH